MKARAASQRQAMRYVERMIEVRGIPWAPRARHGRQGAGSRIPANAAPQGTVRIDTGVDWAVVRRDMAGVDAARRHHRAVGTE